MARTTVTTLAVPRAALAADGTALAFEPLGWRHLAAYLDKVEQMPGDARTLTPALGAAFGPLAEAVRGFGTPDALAIDSALLIEHARPERAYPAFAWTIHRLHAAASEVLSALRACTRQGTAPLQRRETLRGLGALAARGRDQASALLPEIQQFRSAMQDAHARFTAAMAGVSCGLQAEWEAVGGQRARLEHLQADLQRTSILHPHKRQQLGIQIHDAEQSLSAAAGRAGQMRLCAAALHELVQEGAWLAPSLAGVADFLQMVRAAWASFGAAMAQIAADATEAQLADTVWLDVQLDAGEAMARWQELADAADRFCKAAAAPRQSGAAYCAQSHTGEPRSNTIFQVLGASSRQIEL